MFAAGDATSVSVNHSLLATRQADADAASIAAEAGAPVKPDLWEPVLRGILATRPIAPRTPSG